MLSVERPLVATLRSNDSPGRIHPFVYLRVILGRAEEKERLDARQSGWKCEG